MLRYGWTQQAAPPRSPPRNWTSLDLAKPLWEEVMEYKPLWSKLIYCLLPLISNLAKDAAFNTLLFCTGGRQGRRHQSEGLQTRASPTVGFGRGQPQKHKQLERLIIFSEGGSSRRRGEGDVRNMGPVFKSDAGHVAQH